VNFLLPDKIEGILFDFDGTLVDSRNEVLGTFCQFAANHGVTATEGVIALFDGLTPYEIVESAKADWDVRVSLNVLTESYFTLLAATYAQVRESTGASLALAALASGGRRLGLVTSAPEELVEPVLSRFGWSKLFHRKVYGTRGVCGKPHPALYLAALSKFGVDSGNILAVEDCVSGVRSATAAGIRVAAIGHASAEARLRDAGAHLVVEGLPSLVSALP
jgi:mannitol-1-/sugar-/sorbitol-6-/2-deoxyglucose-6-phosphatase